MAQEPTDTGLINSKKGFLESVPDKFDCQLNYDGNLNPDEVSREDESKIRYVMQFLQQIASHELANADKHGGIDMTHNCQPWIDYFNSVPGIFSFVGRREEEKTLKDFSLRVDSDLMETLIDARAPPDIVKSLIGALKSSRGELINVSNNSKKIQYFALIRTYDKASRLIIYNAILNISKSDIKTLCGGAQYKSFYIRYDQIDFEINNQLAIALYPKIVDLHEKMLVPMIEKVGQKLLEHQFEVFSSFIESLRSGEYAYKNKYTKEFIKHAYNVIQQVVTTNENESKQITYGKQKLKSKTSKKKIKNNGNDSQQYNDN